MSFYLFHLFVLLLACIRIGCSKDLPHARNDILSANGLLKNVVSHSPKLSESEINEAEIAVIRTAHLEEGEQAGRVHFCIKNYSSPCPLNWAKVERDGEVVCVAKYAYVGFCERVQRFGDMTVEEKMNFESSCGAQWGCKNLNAETCPGGRDYYRACPDGFAEVEDRSCVADVSEYDGMCSGEQVNFTHMTDAEKEDWSSACGAFWPCLEECAEGKRLSTCPQHWTQIGQFDCEPTDQYTGVCRNRKSFKYFTRAMKEEFESRCSTRFSCEETCEKNYRVACPVGWVLNGKVCEAPETFDSCTRKRFSVDSMAEEEKPQFEKECSVEWPCGSSTETEVCEMDWTAECPYGWSPQGQAEQVLCSPESGLNDSTNCSSITLPLHASEETKREMASTCDVAWPCVDQSPIIDLSKLDSRRGSKSAESGPITNEGRIFRKGKYTIREEDNSQRDYDIMK